MAMMLTATMAWADGIDYIDATGTSKNTATDGINGNDTPTVLTTALTDANNNILLDGWYVVTTDQTFSYYLKIIGDAHLILADGVTLTTDNFEVRSGYSLTIYGQTEGTGSLISTSTRNNYAGIGGIAGSAACGNVTINGGNVTANGGEAAAGIGGGTQGSGQSANCESITINGGTVTATTGGGVGIGGYNAGGTITIQGGQVTASATGWFGVGIGCNSDQGATITLGLTNTSDYIKATGGMFGNYYRGTVTIATGLTLYDGTTSHTGVVEDASWIGTLRPYEYYIVSFDPNDGTYDWKEQEVTAGQTATEPTDPTRDGYEFSGWYTEEDVQWNFANAVTSAITLKAKWTFKSIAVNRASLNNVTKYWGTFYSPDEAYQLSAGAQAFYIKKDSDNTLYLLSDGDVIPARCAVIIMSDTENVGLTKLDGTSLTNPTDNKLEGTAEATAVSSLNLKEGEKVYVMSKVGDVLGFYEYSGTSLPANKAYYKE